MRYNLGEKGTKCYKMKDRITTYVKCCLVILFLILSALYYYALHLQYPPSSEELASIQSIFFHIYYGTENTYRDFLYICALIATKIGGLSFFSMRLCFTFLYIILMCCIMILSLKSKEGNKFDIYYLPIIGLFMVALFPAAENPSAVWYQAAEDLHYIWPYDYHYSSRIFALICLILINNVMSSGSKRKRTGWVVIAALTFLYAMKYTDLVFYIIFVIPSCIVFFLKNIRKDKMKKFFFAGFCIVVCLLFISRISVLFGHNLLWIKDKTSPYGLIYGGTNWISVDLFFTKLQEYVKLILLIFNIPIQEIPVFSFFSAIYLLKLAILIIGYFIIIHIIKCGIRDKAKEYHYDYVDEILAWSYLLLSIFFIFGEFGTVENSRYFIDLTSSMTILLCRNMGVQLKSIACVFDDRIKCKKLFFVLMSILCVCNMDKVWADRAVDSFEDDMKAINDYIVRTGYGCAVATHWVYARMSAMSNGEVIFFPSEAQARSIYGGDTKITYIVTSKDAMSRVAGFTTYDHCENEETIIDYYSMPTDVIYYDELKLLIFENGIKE